MKQSDLIYFILLIASPLSAQWQFVAGGLGTHGSTFAFGVHDSSLFMSSSGQVVRYLSPQAFAGASAGIDFSQGNVTSFASLGKYFFAGIQGRPSYRSNNGGSSWSGSGIASPICSNSNYLFAYGGTGIYRSSDSGAKWEWAASNIPVSNFGTIGSTVFAATSIAVWRTVDDGVSWSKITTPVTTINSFAFIGSITYGANGPIVKSTDSGTTWSEIDIPRRTVSQLASSGSILFAGTDSGVFISGDSGANWRAVSEGLPGRSNYAKITAMIVFDTMLFAGVDAGSGFGYDAARPISEMVSPKGGVQAVAPAAVHDTLQVFPNPANGLVTIRFAGGTPISWVTVLNVLGEAVLELPNPRSSELTLNLSHFASGTYFLRIQSANGTVMRKVIRE